MPYILSDAYRTMIVWELVRKSEQSHHKNMPDDLKIKLKRLRETDFIENKNFTAYRHIFNDDEIDKLQKIFSVPS